MVGRANAVWGGGIDGAWAGDGEELCPGEAHHHDQEDSPRAPHAGTTRGKTKGVQVRLHFLATAQSLSCCLRFGFLTNIFVDGFR
jgi:hypothetical protein